MCSWSCKDPGWDELAAGWCKGSQDQDCPQVLDGQFGSWMFALEPVQGVEWPRSSPDVNHLCTALVSYNGALQKWFAQQFYEAKGVSPNHLLGSAPIVHSQQV